MQSRCVPLERKSAIVIDTPPARAKTAAALKDAGLMVIEADDALDALALLDSVQPDCIVVSDEELRRCRFDLLQLTAATAPGLRTVILSRMQLVPKWSVGGAVVKLPHGAGPGMLLGAVRQLLA